MNQIKPQHQEKTVRIQKLEIAFIDYFSCKTKEKIITNQEIYAHRINKEIMKRKQFTRDNQIKTQTTQNLINIIFKNYIRIFFLKAIAHLSNDKLYQIVYMIKRDLEEQSIKTQIIH
jgi:hypothetical protein